MGFFRTKKLSSPPVSVPLYQARVPYTTEEYRSRVYTPMLSEVTLPGVSTRDTAINWSGKSVGDITLVPSQGGNTMEAVLHIGGVQP